MDIFNFGQNLIIFLLVLSVMVFVHELGHFLVARWMGVKVEEFGLGFPPRVWKKKRGETIYSINAIPIGGFVRLYGEDGGVTEEKSRSFFHKGRLPRIAIVVAGVIMNIFLSIIAFSIISWVVGVPEETGKVKVAEVQTGSPAEVVGLQKEDVVLKINNGAVAKSDEFVEEIRKNRGKEIVLTIERNSVVEQIKVTPRSEPLIDQGALGVAITSNEIVHPPLYLRPFVSFIEGINQAFYWGKVTVLGISDTLIKLVQREKVEGIAGPIGIFQITGEAAKQGGLLSIITLVGILSINLAILNILPIPALDGGRLFFIIVESIFGRKILPTFERYAHTAGMVLLLLLLLLVTLNDITRILVGVKP